MAKHTEPVTQETPVVPPAPPVSRAEPLYSATQLADGHQEFGTSRAVVASALKLAGKDKATLAEARKLIDTFRKKEVK
ncbi:MAG: oligoribonuclease [Ruminiclostridium sp.]|jgi:hypothetical protein|nr:oligoribonuclease [Ruminiclostridium sp.]